MKRREVITVLGRAAAWLTPPNSWFAVQPARVLLIFATCMGLIACGQTTEDFAKYFGKSSNKQDRVEGTCPKARELAVGMTTEQVVAACGSKPIHTADTVTTDGPRQEWVYKETFLVFANGKLARIQPPQ